VLNIATAAAATDGEVKVFCTFEGLNLIHKEVHKQLVSYTLRKMLT
jgi:peroxiredoxin family protein